MLKLGRAMPKALKVEPVAILLGAQHSYQKSLIDNPYFEGMVT